jgi:ubiquinone/menaquinone biosynthesis C-methylase UbiE
MGEWNWHTAAESGASAPELYERYLVPVLFGPWADDLVSLAGLRGRERVLDLACGTGVVARQARAALAEGGLVVGADINQDMLRVARTQSADLAIEWRQADARALPFADHDFDVVFCQQGLQFVPERMAALSEIGRVLATGGRAVLAVWTSIEDSPGFDALASAIASHLGPEAAAGLRRGPFGYDARDDLKRNLVDAGFSEVRAQRREKLVRFPSPDEFVRRYALSTPLASAFSQADHSALAQLTDEVATALKEYTSPAELAFPIVACLAVAAR